MSTPHTPSQPPGAGTPNTEELAKYLFSLSNDEANRLIGWILSELAHTPALAALVAEFKSYREAEAAKREAEFPERADIREPQSYQTQKQAGNSSLSMGGAL